LVGVEFNAPLDTIYFGGGEEEEVKTVTVFDCD